MIIGFMMLIWKINREIVLKVTYMKIIICIVMDSLYTIYKLILNKINALYVVIKENKNLLKINGTIIYV